MGCMNLHKCTDFFWFSYLSTEGHGGGLFKSIVYVHIDIAQCFFSKSNVFSSSSRDEILSRCDSFFSSSGSGAVPLINDIMHPHRYGWLDGCLLATFFSHKSQDLHS